MSRFNWWPISIICLALLVDVAIAARVAQPARGLLVFGFLLVAPGMAFVPLLRIRKTAIELTLAIALSLALDTFVSEAMMLGHVWSVGTALTVLILLSIVGALLQLIALGLRRTEPLGE